MAEHSISLTAREAALVRRPVVGRGGYQSLLRRIQRGLRGRQLAISSKDLDALVRAVSGKKRGGFQQRAEAIVGPRPGRG